MSREQRSGFERQYDAAYHEFEALRKKNTRISACGQEFVLADNVTKALMKQSPARSDGYDHDLHRLGHTAYHRENSAPPQMMKHEYQEYLLVFYTLLDIGAPSLVHQFRDSGRNSDFLPIDMVDLKRNIDPPSDFENFHQKFYDRQFAWCPIKLELGMCRKFHRSISPFSRKAKMEPYRDDAGARHNNANLYTIEVLEELVGPNLRTKMSSARFESFDSGIDGNHSKSWGYRFALKQFEYHKYDQFSNETRMLKNLNNQDGMIQYIGWFQSYEPDGEGGFHEYYNILLELAEFDFYTAIREQSPPISFQEIHGFWNTMSDIASALASIHTVTLDGQDYLTWHGDIKPENILRVNDCFKLADPGEASMSMKSPGMSRPQRTATFGGTRTYAPPEKAIYWNNSNSNLPQVDQTSDVWSLGCVLSVAATYVVLGTQGVLIYNRLRRQEISCREDNGNIDDTFHDGSRVLPEVTDWHKYLREATRKTDAFSAAVLDMIDAHMLVKAGERWTAQQVCAKFAEIFRNSEPQDTEVPDALQEVLQSINSDQLALKYEQRLGIKRVNSTDTADKPRTAESLPDAGSKFKSRQELLEQDILPTAQRSQNRPGSIRQSRRPSSNFVGTLFPSDKRCSTSGIEATDKLEPDVIVSLGTSQKPCDSLDAELDAKLERAFKDRDIVYLIDNGSTMAPHWAEATHLIEVLVWRSLGYDDNGMEIYFTDADTDPTAKVKESPDQTVKEFLNAMRVAAPKSVKSSTVKTTIQPELERIINQYTRAKTSKMQPRKKTIIILTDGIWEGMNNEYTLDTYLMSTLSSLRDLHGDLAHIKPGQLPGQHDIEKIRPVTIQFVQFGQNQRATDRLRRLDDELKLNGYPYVSL
ncbi:Serine/threonine-protein kinase mph1 [Colletotrichum fructicola]|nr:Serine/threonine-protein kinase mph1 [Colletotrichum fructicola]KAF4925262.1 Serine/threonine-protein kinase mph1 [Colletotrichum fructicola]